MGGGLSHVFGKPSQQRSGGLLAAVWAGTHRRAQGAPGDRRDGQTGFFAKIGGRTQWAAGY
jgi:hypothetical protein